jgi:hypothetical protein
MKVVNFEVTIKVQKEGTGDQTAKMSVLIPENLTNTTEILRSIESAVARDIQVLVQQKSNTAPGVR